VRGRKERGVVDPNAKRTPEIVAEILRRQHAEATARDDTVAPVGPPYWGANGLITTVGLLGVEGRKSLAVSPSTDPSMLALMANDPNADVRALVRRHPAWTAAEALLEAPDAPAAAGDDRTALTGDRSSADERRIERWVGLALEAEDHGNFDDARAWYIRAVDAGDSESMLSLGVLHHQLGDVAEAVAWFKRAADAGEVEALADIGRVYYQEGDVGRAVEWFTRGAEAGDVDAMVQLGRLYASRRNPVLAHRWYTRAAEAGNEEARNYLADTPTGQDGAEGAQKGGCYIATAVYGSHDADEVLILRRYRDEALANSVVGRIFIGVYYAVSPSIAPRFAHWAMLNRIARRILNAFVRRLQSRHDSDGPSTG
jgi:tetratricopeptide (TPR) repeat protein